MLKIFTSLTALSAAVALGPAQRFLDEFSDNFMLEDGVKTSAAPECRDGLGWVYHSGHCYLFTSYHEDYFRAEEKCNEVGGYLADVLDAADSLPPPPLSLTQFSGFSLSCPSDLRASLF